MFRMSCRCTRKTKYAGLQYFFWESYLFSGGTQQCISICHKKILMNSALGLAWVARDPHVLSTESCPGVNWPLPAFITRSIYEFLFVSGMSFYIQAKGFDSSSGMN